MSLTRVLETEVMDSAEEARDYNSMDHTVVNLAFAEDLFAAGFRGGDVLDVGTGTALIPVEICRVAKSRVDLQPFRIMAVDLAAHMLDLARYNLEIAGITQIVQLAQVDAKKMPYPDAMFDAVISNSIVHHIPEPIGVICECVRVLRPMGLIFIRDLMRPGSDAMVRQLVETYAGEENEHSQKMFDDSLRAALSLTEVRTLVAATGLDPHAVVATSDRHWTWSARKPNLP